MNGDFRKVKSFLGLIPDLLPANLCNQAINREIRGIGRLFLHGKAGLEFFANRKYNNMYE